MIRRLVLDIPTNPESQFTRVQNHHTGGYTVWRNGQPVIETTTRLEADDEIADLEREVRRQQRASAAPVPPMSAEERKQAADALWGE